ncbi:hypothetical protein DENSPDRAFT_849298 [Dentipellis sp. KUC8613]|nr:hypothetical protein DENSPDRAFT_849298 [Dentipellis sp. KUC8613]
MPSPGEDHETATHSHLTSQPWHSLVNSGNMPIDIDVDIFVEKLLKYPVDGLNIAALQYYCPDQLKKAYLWPEVPGDRLTPLDRIIDDVHIRARRIVRTIWRDRVARGVNAELSNRLYWRDLVDSEDIFVVDKQHVKLMEATPKPSLPSTRATRRNHERKRKSEDVDTGIHKRQKNADGLPISILVPGIYCTDDPKPEQKKVAPTCTTEVRGSAKGMALMLHVAQERLTSAAGRRRHVLALLVDGPIVRLVCFDCMTIHITRPVHIFKEPELLVLIVVALFASDRVHLGYEPLISPPTKLAPHGMLCIPSSGSWDRDGNFLAEDAPFVISGEPIYVESTLLGRATVVLPVDHFPAGLCNVNSKTSSLIAKMGWPLQMQTSEDKIIREIRREVGPCWEAYIPRIECSWGIMSQWNIGILPRIATVGSDLSQNQVFRVLVCERLEHLWTVSSLDEFKTVFLDLVRFHYVAYTKAGILHGDLSFANLMLRRDEAKNVTGVLNDWDMAIRMKSPNRRLPGGTMPFIAMELLQDCPPPQRYRHDLESFVWILVWSMYQIDFTGADLPQCDELSDHLDVDSDVLMRERVRFMMADVHAWKFQPQFEPLVDKWLKPLFDMLLQAVEMHAENDWQDVNDGTFDNETLGGLMTYDGFMRAIDEDPRLPEPL